MSEISPFDLYFPPNESRNSMYQPQSVFLWLPESPIVYLMCKASRHESGYIVFVLQSRSYVLAACQSLFL